MSDPATNGVISGLILIGLYSFGFLYNRWIERMESDLDGFTWLAVGLGVSVTLVGIGLMDLVTDINAGLLGLAAFVASGFEMSRGSVMRYIEKRRRLKEMI